jgi:hypothetical protein
VPLSPASLASTPKPVDFDPVGRFDSYKAVDAALEKALGKPALDALQKQLGKADHVPLAYVVQAEPQTGYSARGWLGQYLVVYRKERVVAVRMRRAIYSDYDGGMQRNGYDAFAADAAALF